MLSTIVDGFEIVSHEDTRELKVDLPTNTFNQIMLGPKTIEGGADAILGLLPKEREYSLWSWGKRINGIGPVQELSAMMCQPDPWAPDPHPGPGQLIFASSEQHYQVAGEVIARTAKTGEAAVLRRVFNSMKVLPSKERDKMKRVIYTMENRAVATICLYQNEDCGLIFDFAVQPSEQGKGFGSTLLGIAIRELMNSGCWRIHLQAVSTATDLYRKFDFQTVGKVYEAHGNANKDKNKELPPDPKAKAAEPGGETKKRQPAQITGVVPNGPGDRAGTDGDAAPTRSK